MNDTLYRRLLAGFLVETRLRLDDIDHALDALAHDHTDTDARRRLANAAYAIKGTAMTLGLRGIGDEARRMELFGLGIATEPEAFDTLGDARDHLSAQLEDAAADADALVATAPLPTWEALTA